MNFITVKDMANILKVSTKTISNMIKSGKLKAVEVGGEERITYRIFEKEILRFMAENYEKYKVEK